MVESHADQLNALAKRLEEVEHYLQIEQKRYRRAELQESSAQPGFWDDPQAAQAVMGEISRLGDDIKAYDGACELLEEAQSADELALEADDEETSEYAGDCVARLGGMLDELELSSWFTGKFDHGDAVVTITPGQGGYEAQDWTEMLLHMYLRYCEQRRWKVEVTDAPVGELIGLDRATFTVSGKDAFGMLSSEAGVHRLVRISPFDASARRHTSFASLEVMPEIEDDADIVISPDDLKVDTYRSSGAGGQHINKTDSAVRMTHVPTGIVVSCQTERSQIQNRETAMRMLRSRLAELKERETQEKLSELHGELKKIEWGSQIRSYVFQPYTMVKDHRTGAETGNVDAVMNGDLDLFIHAYLKKL